jgi:hypothetical protein
VVKGSRQIMSLMDFLQGRYAKALRGCTEEKLLEDRKDLLATYEKTIFPNRKDDLLRQIASINAELERRQNRES